MPAYVHINLRVIDPAKQAALAPRFQAALQEAGGRILYFGRVAQVLEGDERLSQWPVCLSFQPWPKR